MHATCKSTAAASFSPAEYALTTYGAAVLPDARLHKRLLLLVERLAAKPLDSIPQACSPAETKGGYRLMENERVTVQHLIDPLVAAGAQACQGESVILCPQDTSTLSFPNAMTMQGLGPVNDSQARGMLLHSALALTTSGVPLGLLHINLWCRDPDEQGKRHQRKQLAIEDKESHKWLQAVAGVRQALATLLPEKRPRVIHIADRECDIHEVLQEIVESGDGAVIRSTHNRRALDGESEQIVYAHTVVADSQPLGSTEVLVGRREGAAQRMAQVELRARPIVLAPRRPAGQRLHSIELWLVEVREIDAPPDVTPLLWRLWTTESVSTLEDARRVVDWYARRWRIEDFHFVLKSGCQVERTEFETAERTGKIIALYLGIAVQLLRLRDLARDEPEAPCTRLLSKEEWHVLWLAIHQKLPTTKTSPPTLQQAVLWIGRLGGHLNRKSDGMPGVKTLWRGWRDLQLMVTTIRAHKQALAGTRSPE